MVFDDVARLLYLTSLAAGGGRTTVPIASGKQTPLHTANYVVHAAVGTPPQSLLMAMDTSNAAAWVPSAVFSIAASPTFKTLPCGAPQCRQVPNPICSDGPAAMAYSYNLTYGGASFAADLAQDTITLSSDSFPSYTFACPWTPSPVTPSPELARGGGGGGGHVLIFYSRVPGASNVEASLKLTHFCDKASMERLAAFCP